VREIDVEKFDVEAKGRVVDGFYLVLPEHQTLRDAFHLIQRKVGRKTQSRKNNNSH
jgi:hypothetical protein